MNCSFKLSFSTGCICSGKVSSLFPGPEAPLGVQNSLAIRLEHFTVPRFAYFHRSTPHVRLVLLHKRFAHVFDLSTIFKLIEPTLFLLLSRSILPMFVAHCRRQCGNIQLFLAVDPDSTGLRNSQLNAQIHM